MALHFEQKKQHLLAGKFFSKAGQYSKVSQGKQPYISLQQFLDKAVEIRNKGK